MEIAIDQIFKALNPSLPENKYNIKSKDFADQKMYIARITLCQMLMRLIKFQKRFYSNYDHLQVNCRGSVGVAYPSDLAPGRLISDSETLYAKITFQKDYSPQRVSLILMATQFETPLGVGIEYMCFVQMKDQLSINAEYIRDLPTYQGDYDQVLRIASNVFWLYVDIIARGNTSTFDETLALQPVWGLESQIMIMHDTG